MAPSGRTGPAASVSGRRDLLVRVARDFRANHRDGLLCSRFEELPDLDTVIATCGVFQVAIVVLDVLELVMEYGDQRVIVVPFRHCETLPDATDRRRRLWGQLCSCRWG